MAKIFVLVNAEIGKAKEVLSELEKTGLEAHPLFGEYDYMVIVETADLKAATTAVLEKIHTIAGVTRTRTLVGAEM